MKSFDNRGEARESRPTFEVNWTQPKNQLRGFFLTVLIIRIRISNALETEALKQQ
jgi:hypothetical protein